MDKANLKLVSFRLSPTGLARLDACATSKGMSRTDVVRVALADYLARQDTQQHTS